jgi:hypothetical protein
MLMHRGHFLKLRVQAIHQELRKNAEPGREAHRRRILVELKELENRLAQMDAEDNKRRRSY